MSAPSTSGYSGRRKSSLTQQKKNNKRNSNNKNLRNADKAVKRSARNGRKIGRRVSLRSKNNKPTKRSRRCIVKEDSDEHRSETEDIHENIVEEEENDDHFDEDYVVDEEAIGEEVINHFDSDTEVEDNELKCELPADSDATEIDGELDGLPQTSGLRYAIV